MDAPPHEEVTVARIRDEMGHYLLVTEEVAGLNVNVSWPRVPKSHETRNSIPLKRAQRKVRIRLFLLIVLKSRFLTFWLSFPALPFAISSQDEFVT